MRSVGVFEPETVEEARASYSMLRPTAKAIVRETAKAMGFDSEEYTNRVTQPVIDHVHEALFAELLVVTIGPKAKFDAYAEEYPGEIIVVGSEHVDYAAWHTASIANTVIAATFQGEESAASATLRRQAFGRVYREYLT